MIDYSELYQYCTPRQLEILKMVEREGSNIKASRPLNITRRAVDHTVNNVKIKAAKYGWQPSANLTHHVGIGQKLLGASSLYRAGQVEPVLQWVKSTIDSEQQAIAQKAAIEAMCEDIKPQKSVAFKGKTLDHLCNVYVLTDSHVGMLAWRQENLEADWDLKIAEETLAGCFEQMILNSPKSKSCVVSQLGDFLHYDSLSPVTPSHGHILDADGRYGKMVKTAIRILRRVINFSLMHHEEVIVLMAEGNHDPASSVWLRAMFAALYEKETRVKVIDSELPYYIHQHGQTMLAFHHGHLKKNDQLPILFASQFPEIWGSTKRRYCHTGHRHHVEEKEHSGMTVIQHSTLAARDAYASRGGWMSERQITSITYSDKFGQVARNTVTPEMLGSNQEL